MYFISLLSIARIARYVIRATAVAAAGVFALISVSGCALLSDQLDRAAKGAGRLVTYYCENVTLPEAREEIRLAVNKHADPHTIAVECGQGGPVLVATPEPMGAERDEEYVEELKERAEMEQPELEPDD